MASQVAGDKRLRALILEDAEADIEEEYTEPLHPPKRLKLIEETSSTSASVECSDIDEHHLEITPHRLSQTIMAEIMQHSSHLAKQQTTTNTTLPPTLLRNPPTDEALVLNILSYNPTTRRPTYDIPSRPPYPQKLLTDFTHIGYMTWCLICEYSKICTDLSSRSDAVNAIQNYLIRNINNVILRNLYRESSYELKYTALEVLCKITFCTLSNDPKVNRINGLLHARVCDFIGEAMVRVVDVMDRGEKREFVREGGLFGRIGELRGLVGELRWEIEGLERVWKDFEGCGREEKGGKLKRYSLKFFQKGKVVG